MKTFARATAAGVVLCALTTANAQIVAECTPGSSSDPAIVSACEAQLGADLASVEVVCINDFTYDPPLLTVAAGSAVAWINVEACGDSPVEEVVVPQTGCDSHHQVVTTPENPLDAASNVASGPICSPNPGLTGAAGVPLDADDCAGDGVATNVFCHAFTSPGVQHYSCFTNPGHTALMHGGVVVQ